MTAAVAYDVSKKPGEWVSARSRREIRRMWLLLAVVFAAGALAIPAALAGYWVASICVSVVGILVAKWFASGQIDVAERWFKGSNAEVAVGEALEELRRDGYYILHDVPQTGEGNIDHIVAGPSGVFLIETKFQSYHDRALPKARRQAKKLHDELGVWVTPVICKARSGKKPYRHQRVAIVGLGDLREWIKAQREPTVDFARLAAFADTL